mgnify:FL=1
MLGTGVENLQLGIPLCNKIVEESHRVFIFTDSNIHNFYSTHYTALKSNPVHQVLRKSQYNLRHTLLGGLFVAFWSDSKINSILMNPSRPWFQLRDKLQSNRNFTSNLRFRPIFTIWVVLAFNESDDSLISTESEHLIQAMGGPADFQLFEFWQGSIPRACIYLLCFQVHQWFRSIWTNFHRQGKQIHLYNLP